MAYPVAQLIADSFYLSGKRTEGLQPVKGPDIIKGLRLLNAFLAFKTANKRLIPYYSQYDLTAVIAQEMYFIPNLISIETFTWELQGVRMYSNHQTRVDYFGSARVQSVMAPPYSWHEERCKGGMNLYLFFQPDQTYPLTIWGKFSLTSVVLSQDLEATMDDYYIEYLRYGLTDYICDDANITMQASAKKKLEAYEKQITDISPPDLRTKKISAFGGCGSIGFYGYANLGKGWVPG